MATRLYFSLTGHTAPVTPAFSPDPDYWNETGSAERHRAMRAKQGTALADIVHAPDANVNNRDVLLGQFISEPLTAQSLPSSATFGLSIRGREATAANEYFLSLVVKVVTSAGSLRGYWIYDGGFPLRDTTELGTSSQPSRYLSGSGSNTIAAQAGDFLVVEVGFGGNPDNTNGNGGAQLRFGDDTGTDLAAADGDTDDDAPWIEFSTNIAFSTTHAAVAALAGAGTVAPAAGLRFPSSAALAAAGTLTPAALVTRRVTAALAGSVALSATATPTLLVDAALAGSGALTADALATRGAGAVLPAVVTLSPAGHIVLLAAAELPGVTTLAGIGGLPLQAGEAALDVTGALAAAAEALAALSAQLPALASLAPLSIVNYKSSALLEAAAVVAGNGGVQIGAAALSLVAVVTMRAVPGNLFGAVNPDELAGRMFLEIYEAGVLVGEGPVGNLITAEVTHKLDRAGGWKVLLAANDPRRTLLTHGREVRISREGEGEIARGIIMYKEIVEGD